MGGALNTGSVQGDKGAGPWRCVKIGILDMKVFHGSVLGIWRFPDAWVQGAEHWFCTRSLGCRAMEMCQDGNSGAYDIAWR